MTNHHRKATTGPAPRKATAKPKQPQTGRHTPDAGRRRSHRPTANHDPRRKRVERAFGELLAALGAQVTDELAETPARAASLWLSHLLAGDSVPSPASLPERASRAVSQDPVSVLNIGVHLVCPHHLTVAFGQAHLAYIPTDLIAGFGALADLVAHFTARLALQEDATAAIANALVEHLHARAAVVVVSATHPCHNIIHPRSHRARAITWAAAGSARAAKTLRQDLHAALAESGKAVALE